MTGIEPRRTHLQLTPEVQAIICDRVAHTGDLGIAARTAFTSVNAIRARQQRDPAFDEAMQQAWRDFADLVLIPAVKQRAVDGVPRGVYYRGQIAKNEHNEPVYELHYDNNLLLRFLEVLDSRFRPHQVNEIRTPVNAAAMDDLTPEQRQKLEAFLDSMPQAQAPRDVEPLPPQQAGD